MPSAPLEKRWAHLAGHTPRSGRHACAEEVSGRARPGPCFSGGTAFSGDTARSRQRAYRTVPPGRRVFAADNHNHGNNINYFDIILSLRACLRSDFRSVSRNDDLKRALTRERPPARCPRPPRHQSPKNYDKYGYKCTNGKKFRPAAMAMAAASHEDRQIVTGRSPAERASAPRTVTPWPLEPALSGWERVPSWPGPPPAAASRRLARVPARVPLRVRCRCWWARRWLFRRRWPAVCRMPPAPPGAPAPLVERARRPARHRCPGRPYQVPRPAGPYRWPVVTCLSPQWRCRHRARRLRYRSRSDN